MRHRQTGISGRRLWSHHPVIANTEHFIGRGEHQTFWASRNSTREDLIDPDR